MQLYTINIIQYHFVCGKCGSYRPEKTKLKEVLFYSPVRKQEPVGYYAHLRSVVNAVHSS